jgi:hypothetical protein
MARIDGGSARLFLIALAGILLAAALTACVPESEHPLSSPDAAVIDERLVGLWSGELIDEPMYLHVLWRTERTVQFLLVNPEEPPVPGSWFALAVHSSEIDGDWYINAKSLAEEEMIHDLAGEDYLLFRYDVTARGELVVWAMSEMVYNDIRSGTLEGAVKNGDLFDTFHITAETGSLVEYIRRNGVDAVFGIEIARFRRIAE